MDFILFFLFRRRVIDDHAAEKMVGFMLKNLGQRAGMLPLNSPAGLVPLTKSDPLRTVDRDPDAGKTEAPLFQGRLPGRCPEDLGIDDRKRAVPVVRHKDLLVHADLGRGQAEPVKIIHRPDHLLDDEPLDRPHAPERFGRLAQDGIPEISKL